MHASPCMRGRSTSARDYAAGNCCRRRRGRRAGHGDVDPANCWQGVIWHYTYMGDREVCRVGANNGSMWGALGCGALVRAWPEVLVHRLCVILSSKWLTHASGPAARRIHACVVAHIMVSKRVVLGTPGPLRLIRGDRASCSRPVKCMSRMHSISLMYVPHERCWGSRRDRPNVSEL